jgi:hypothetical protein
VEGRAYVSDIMLGLVLFVATALTVYPLFTGDFTRNWGSIEAAYISDSIFVAKNFPSVGWFPFWYGGLPFHLSYPPLFIYAVALLQAISGSSVGHSYRILSGIAYSAAPVALYLLAKYLTKNKRAGFLAGLDYSFVPTFLPLPYSIAPSHVGILTFYGEAPHFFGFTLTLLALWQLMRCMNKPTRFRSVSAAALMACVTLTNLVALYGLAFLVLVAVITEVVYRNDKGLRAFALAGLITYGLVAFQYDLEFIRSSAQVSAETAGGVRYSLLLLPALLIAVVIVRRFFSRYLTRRPNTKPSFFIALWLVLLGVIVIGRVWFNLPQLAPQPNRYVPEFDAGVSLLIGLVIVKMDKAALSLRGIGAESIRMVRRGWILGSLLILVLVSVLFLMPISLNATQPSTSLAGVPEYQIANWLSAHVNDESVFATGSVAFWLNVFSNVRQVRGGSDQGATNTWWAAVTYQILTGPDPEVSILWAQAWNVKYIVVTYPNASTEYHDYIHPDKFSGTLPLRFYFEGNGVFEVPLAHPELVEALSARDAASLNPISDVLDRRGLSAYVQLTQNETNSDAKVEYNIVNPDLLTISVTNATPDTAVLVKMTFDPRWQADLNGKPVKISQIGPDFMVTCPRVEGQYHLTFHFWPSQGELIGSFVTLAVIGVLAAESIAHLYQRKRRRTIPPNPRSSALERRD